MLQVPLQIEKACAAEAIWRLELGKVPRSAESLPAAVSRSEIDFRLRSGGISPRTSLGFRIGAVRLDESLLSLARRRGYRVVTK